MASQIGPEGGGMRYLALDLGERRTGLAAADDVTGVASPWRVIEQRVDTEAWRKAVEAAVAEYGPDALVIGYPLNMDGTESPGAKRARERAEALRDGTGRATYLVDERLTSDAADDVMSQSGWTHKQKKKRRDALAAAAVLERFLDSGGAPL